MKLLLFFFLSFYNLLAVAQQKDSLKVQVKDALSKNPLPGAIVTFSNNRILCDSTGNFSLIRTALSKITITHTGYQPVETTPPNNTDFYTLYLTPLPNLLEDIVVSGTLKPVKRLQSTLAITSISQAFFKVSPSTSLFESMAMVNGVRPQITCNVCNTGDIRILGMDGAYTMILIDGMPIVSSLSTVYGLSGIPSSMIQRLEVIKGAASTLFGSEAVGGVINIITKNPLTAPRFFIDVHHSSYGETNTDVSFTVKGKKAMGMIAWNGFLFDQRWDKNKDGFTDITLQKRSSLFTKWDVERPKQLAASFALRLFAENRWGGEIRWNNSNKGSNEIYGEAIATKRLEWIGRYDINKEIQVNYSYNYHWQNSYYGIVNYKASQHTAFTQVRWDKTLGKHALMAGLPVKYILYDDNTIATSRSAGNPSRPQWTKALFVQDEITFNAKSSLLAGLRYEHTNLHGGILAPRITYRWQPWPHHSLRLSTGNGFRIVNLFTEDHAAISGFRTVEIIGNLQPEKSWNVHLNYTGDVHINQQNITWDVEAFHTRFSNKIVPDYLSDPQKIIYHNLQGYAISKGLSANFTWLSTQGQSINAAITLMDVYSIENNSNHSLRTKQLFAPSWSGNYTISLPIRKQQLKIDITGHWTGPMQLPVVTNDFRASTSPWFSIVNIQCTKRWNASTETYLSIKNLLNFLPKYPVLHPDDPFDTPGGRYWEANGNRNTTTNPNGYSFDPSYNYAPMQGVRAIAGIRISW